MGYHGDVTAEAPTAVPEKLAWRSRATRRQLLVWTVGPWLGIFVLTHQILIGCQLPSPESIFSHAYLSLFGLTFLLWWLPAKMSEAVGVGIDLAFFAIMVAAEMRFLKTRKVGYLVIFEVLVALFMLGGVLVILVLEHT